MMEEPDQTEREERRPAPPDLFSHFATITLDGKTGAIAKKKHR